MISIAFHEKLVRSPEAVTASARGALSLMERGLTRYFPPWDKPVIVALYEGIAVGVLVVDFDLDELSASVRLAWCHSCHPTALASMLSRLRVECRDRQITEVFFTAHDENGDMARAAEATRATLHSRTFRVQLETGGAA